MNKNSEMSDQSFAAIVALIFLIVFGAKYRVTLIELYFKNRIVIALLLSVSLVASYLQLKKLFLKRFAKKFLEADVLTAREGEDAIFAGIAKNGKRIDVKHAYRRMHTQVVGTTNAGKTESIIIPWAVDDIKKDRGLIIVDGKSDSDLLNKLYAYAKRHGREDDVRLLSICNPAISHTFNPLAGGSPLEITERVFKALTFDNEYYKDLQYEALLFTLLIFEANKIRPTPVRVVEFLRSPAQIKHLAEQSGNTAYVSWVAEFLKMSAEERRQKTSGLISKLQIFTVGETAAIFNSENSDIDLEKALSENQIIYCQLPVLKIPTLGKIVGKLVLQALQGAIASRHLSSSAKQEFFSVYLDDFTEYLTEGFVSMLNKSRSANVLVTFAHQALGDLAVLGDDIKNTILTNANLKVFMRTNEPTSAEYFSEVIGTSQTAKVTERQTKGALGPTRTGEGSVRDAEEFKIHPNVFKQDLGVGEAVLVIPHAKGSLPIRLQLRKLPDLAIPKIPNVLKSEPVGLAPVDEKGRPASETQPSSTLKQVSSIMENFDQNPKEVAA